MENVIREQEPTTKIEWKPSRIMALRTYEINIKFLDRGVLVGVGCRQIAYENVNTFLIDFNEYVANPAGVQEKWLKEFENN